MKKISAKNVIYSIVGIVIVSVMLLLMFSSAKSKSERRCSGMKIKIKDQSQQLLVKTSDVEKWVTLNGTEPVEGKLIEKIDLHLLETRLKNTGYVEECEAYIDLIGNLNLKLKIYEPVARILGDDNFSDRYLDKNGNLFPTSPNFTPTVILVSGEYFNNKKSLKSDKNLDLLGFINKVTNDEFWNAQITRIIVNNNKEISLVPMLGNHIIEFGKPQQIDTKLDKLMIFYKKILPQNQWERFNKISVKYDGQIVCS